MRLKLAILTIGIAAAAAFHATLRAQQTPPPQTPPSQQPAAPPQTPPQQPPAAAPAAPAGERTVWDGVYSEEQAKRGAAVFDSDCASCHGPDMNGGEMAPPLSGPAFTANWEGLTIGDLFERIRISMPQDQPGRLSRQQNADVLAQMLSVSKFPAGKTELPTQLEVLKQIKYVSTKP